MRFTALGIVGLAWLLAAGAEPARALHFDEIVVGIRADAPPFASRSPFGTPQTLDGYQGYVVTICRQILDAVRQREPFLGAAVKVVPVKASDRFKALDEGRADMLCGPDSVTMERLRTYRASTPVFLTGVSFAYLLGSSERFPRGRYCKAVVGVVAGTTAEESGLRTLAEEGAFLRFNYAVTAALDLRQSGRANEFNEIASGDDCQSGFTQDPIQSFGTHTEAVKALCAGDILYYVGDVDILSYHLEQRSDCEAKIERYTVSREIYAIFFAPPPLNMQAASPEALPDLVKADILYSRFSSTLMQHMQTHENVLEFAFSEAFPDKVKSDDLRDFFSSLVVNAN